MLSLGIFVDEGSRNPTRSDNTCWRGPSNIPTNIQRRDERISCPLINGRSRTVAEALTGDCHPVTVFRQETL